MSADRLLSVIAHDGVVHIHGNAAGLRHLRDELTFLLDALASGRCEHTHLFTPDAAGDELSTSMLDTERPTFQVVHHLQLFAWTEEWQRNHNLTGLPPAE